MFLNIDVPFEVIHLHHPLPFLVIHVAEIVVI
jgi:hypothetical protein